MRLKSVAVPLMRKAGERAALVPINVRSWPNGIHQSKMPDSLRAKMVHKDNHR